MLNFIKGDIFSVEADIKINTVNCVGVMGKGVALGFKQRFPDMFKQYKEKCRTGEVQPGSLTFYTTMDGMIIVNFPTKDHWKDDSKYDFIKQGLVSLREFIQTYPKDTIVAIPPLGCGCGNLRWSIVSLLIRGYLGDLPHTILVIKPHSYT